MQINTKSTFRSLAAVGALALAASGAAFVTSPAQAATSASLTYTCTFPFVGEQTLTMTHSVPDTVEYAGMVPVTTTITIPNSLRQPLYDALGAREIDGTDTSYAALAGGIVKLGVEQAIPRTPVPASGDMTVISTGEVDTAPYSGAVGAGDAIDVALDDRTGEGAAATDLIANLNAYGADGASVGQFNDVPCELADGQNLAVGVVTIVQANTETASSLVYKAKKDKLVGKATVDAPESGALPVGNVKMVIKRNGEILSSTTKALNSNGVATVSVPNAKNGNYKLIAKYLGDEDGNFNTSGSTATKSVG